MSREISLLLAGDALITRPWSQVRDADFLGLIEEIRGADAAIANLETVIHEFKGHAQADSGGTHMASPPSIAAELKWAGFDMLSHANNHAFDYGASGVLETIDYVERAGLVLAGSGPDLQRARAPQYVQCDGGRVALVAMAADFVSYGKASASRPDIHGRPGVNPLTVESERSATVRPLQAAGRAWEYCRRMLRAPAWREPPGLEIAISWGRKIVTADATANLQSIAEAAANADIVVASIHAHRRGKWLTQFAHHAIERGASVIVVTGPHQVRGVELYRGRPIFYSMGDFAFETEYIERFPVEVYESAGLVADASIEELRSRPGPLTEMLRDRRTFEGFVTQLLIADGHPRRIQLIPIDLQFDGDKERRGRPKLASAGLGERIVATVAAKSRKLGAQVSYDPGSNRGEVGL
jgi:poly-gamma-glutamate synthesis protein (capsule biosynthesis protein)